MIFEDRTYDLGIIEEIKSIIIKKINILREIKGLYALKESEDSKIISSQIKDLKDELKKLNERTGDLLEKIKISKKSYHALTSSKIEKELKKKEEKFKLNELEEETINRIKKKGNLKKEKEIKENKKEYTKLANKIFSAYSKKLIEKGYFKNLEVDLSKSNLNYPLKGYVSMILLTTLLSWISALIIFTFFLFFKINPVWPIIFPVENLGARFVRLIWIIVAFPLAGYIISYSYPSLERKSSEAQIDYELPFATINMAAIAGSMINPVKIFEILITAEEFPYIKKEMIKLVNEVNAYGYDLVSALRNAAFNSPSSKLTELFNGLATTINSGGDLAQFFEKRSESLLFEYKIMREKETKTAETFMDLYISIVIAAPMIFMLLLMMMKISGLGISMSTSSITLIMVSSVVVINIFFLVFLHLKKTT